MRRTDWGRFAIKNRTLGGTEVLQDGADKLLTKLIVRPDRDRKGDELKHAWLLRAKYSKGQGSVTITWHPDVRPYLFCLRQEFTTYKLKHAAALRSISQ